MTMPPEPAPPGPSASGGRTLGGPSLGVPGARAMAETLRPPLVRLSGQRTVSGVAAGVARHLGCSARTARVAFALLSLANGAGALAYIVLWALLPVDESDTLTAPVWRAPVSWRPTQWALVGVAVAVAGALTLGLWRGYTPDGVTRVALPTVLLLSGAVVAWSQLHRPGHLRKQTAWRVALGAAIAVGGALSMFLVGQPLEIIWSALVALVAVLGGLALVLTPWAATSWERYTSEQRERIRATEKADLAAHLHDSVLQTLAMIQRTPNPQRASQLARAQERELRQWLYGGATTAVESLASSLITVAEELEDLHGVPVEVVTTGDTPWHEDLACLVAATREAVSNAVRHGAPPVRMFAEITTAEVEVFVRDHGVGFALTDLDDVPADRRGVRDSVVGRLERHGGTATYRRREPGTEVELRLPRPTDSPTRPSEETP